MKLDPKLETRDRHAVRPIPRTSRTLAIVAAALAILAAACGKESEPPDIMKSQRQAMDKAKAVEQVLQKSADERREQVDRQQ